MSKVALVTGGRSGIGLACAKRLMEEGCSVEVAAVDKSAPDYKGCLGGELYLRGLTARAAIDGGERSGVFTPAEAQKREMRACENSTWSCILNPRRCRGCPHNMSAQLRKWLTKAATPTKSAGAA